MSRLAEIDRQLAEDERAAEKFDPPVDTWQDPEPLPDDLPPVAELDPAMIPEPLRGWIGDIAERMQIPMDYPAAAAVVALGALIGRKTGIHPKRRDDWLVIPNLWGAVVGRPAMMKSPAIQQATMPLNRLMAEAMKVFQEEQSDFARQSEMAAAMKKARKTKLEQAAKKGGDLEAIAAQSIEDPDPPTLRRYVTQDSTVAAIGQLLLDNPNGLLVLRDELVGWLRNLDREGNEGDRAFYLESWNGQGSFTVDRIGRGTLHIPALTLSIFGSIQPGPLRDYVYQSAQGGRGDDGLIQRLQLVIWPDASAEWKNVDRWPNSVAKTRAFEIFQKIDRITPEQITAKAEDPEAIPALRFVSDAQSIFDEWRAVLEQRLRDGTIVSPALESHMAKYRSLFPSLALIFHLVNVADGHSPGPVSLEAAMMAAAWCEYLETHAKRLYAAVEDPAIESARILLARLRSGSVRLTDGAFKPRDIYRNGWMRLSTPEEVAAAIDILEDFGWVRTEPVPTSPIGGRPTKLIYLHPVISGGQGNGC